MPLNSNLRLRKWQTLTRCNPQLPLDQIESCHHLGDWVLDLKSRVHLHKIEMLCTTAFITGDQKFDGPSADVMDRARRSDRRLPERLA